MDDMRYPMLYTLRETGEPCPITDVPEFCFTLQGGKSDDFSPLYVRHSAELPLNQVVSLTFIKPENFVESCSACTELNSDGSEWADTGESAMLVFTDDTGRVEALCYGCSIGRLAWV